MRKRRSYLNGDSTKVDPRDLTFKILEFHAYSSGLPGKTWGEIAEAIAAPRSAAVHQRQTDLRNGVSPVYGTWSIEHPFGEKDRYFMPLRERTRARAFCRAARAAWDAKQNALASRRIERAQRRAA